MSECQAYEISELGTYEKALEAKQPTCTLTARPEVDPNVPEMSMRRGWWTGPRRRPNLHLSLLSAPLRSGCRRLVALDRRHLVRVGVGVRVRVGVRVKVGVGVGVGGLGLGLGLGG